MKTIWGLLVIISFGALLFGGVYTSLTEIESKNTRLTEDSANMIGKYNKQYNNLSGFQNLDRPATNFSNNNTNQVDAFFREYSEAKNNVNKFRSGINFIYDIPEILLLSIPFAELTPNNLKIYKNIIWLLMVFMVILVIYKALRGGKVDNE